MESSKGKIIALVLFLVLLAWLVLSITPFSFAPFGIFSTVSRTVKHTIDNGMSFGHGFPLPFYLVRIFSLILLVLWIMVIVWVYRDAERRGMNGFLWAVLVFIGNLIGLIIYLIIRTETRSRDSGDSTRLCPECQKPIRPEFAFCPGCGKTLKPLCPNCQGKIQEEWKICPHCGRKIKK